MENSIIRITETRNPSSTQIDQLGTLEILKLINQEDQKVAKAVEKVIPEISQAVERISAGMKKNGRLFYIGAGTSGRLGVLDAVECMPTFSIEPGKVIGIMAGGKDAIFRAKENLEDQFEAGAQEIKNYNLTENDSLVGIAASGTTPFVLGAIDECKKRGGTTIALVCTENSPLEKEADIAIIPITGPEILTGSTRMKAGTAQKMVLNMISTTVMIKLGKTYSNLMVDLKPTNIKLQERAKNIFMTINNSDYETAEDFLDRADSNLKAAIVMYQQNIDLEQALEKLDAVDGVLAKVIDV